MKTKVCSKCKENKSTNYFYRDSQKVDGYRPDCKTCTNKNTSNYVKNHRKDVNFNNLKWKTGLSKADYLKMLKLQNSKCAICSLTQGDTGKKLSVDHDHLTSYIRGLLCSRCNQGLGYFKDDITLLNLAIKYLKANLSKEKIKYGKAKI